MEEVPPKTLREIETLVQRAIARYGIAGKVRIEADQVVLDAPGGGGATEIGDLATSWPELSVAERQRRIGALARTLVVERGVHARRAPERSARLWLGAGGLLALAAGAFLLTRSRDTGPQAAAPAAMVEDDEALELEKRACEASSARAAKGATLDQDDTRGWVVELSLLRRGEPDVVFDPGLLAFIERAPGRLVGRFVWAGAREISALEGPGTEVEVLDAGPVGKHMRGATLVFKGRYVKPYFSRDRRDAFVRTATAISERLATTFAGLQARCAHQPARFAGAWFRGPSESGAAAAMVWFMGERQGRFDAVAERADVIDRVTIERFVGAHGGALASAGGPTTLDFPFDDAARARRAAGEISRELGLGKPR